MHIKSILIAGIIAATSNILLAEPKTELLPEVKDILQIKYDENTMQQNAYVALMGISAPEGVDYKELGKKVITTNIQLIKAASERAGLQDSSKKYVSPKDYFQNSLLTTNFDDFKLVTCKLVERDCVTRIIEQQQTVEQLLEKYHVLLARYVEIVNLPSYSSTYMDFIGPIPPFHTARELHHLRIAKAVLLINQGKIEEGLAIFQQEINHYKRILTSRAAVVDQMMAVGTLLRTYHIISQLLDTPQLAKQLENPKLLSLLKPFTQQEQQALSNAFAFERDMQIIWLSAETKDSILKGLEETGQAVDKNVALTFDKNATMNINYQQYQPLIKQAQLTLPESSKNYIAHLQVIPKHKERTTEQILKEFGKDNYLGGIILDNCMPVYTPYLARLYDVVSYLQLVETKLKIKQAAITKAQVPTFLTKLGDQAKNPYSQEPFVWDADKQTLSSKWLDTKKDAKWDGERASVDIQFAQ